MQIKYKGGIIEFSLKRKLNWVHYLDKSMYCYTFYNYIAGEFNNPKDVEPAAKKWTNEKQINAPIIECYKDYCCDVVYSKNDQIYTIKLSCTKEKCRLD